MIKPKKLEKGQTIGVISPSSPSEKKSEVARAAETIESLGYKVVIGKNVNKTKGITAASEEDRVTDIHEMFRRDDVDAVWVTQGGINSAQMIRRLDFGLIRSNPKIFTGFSDITSLHLAIGKLADVVTFHGPGMSRFNSEDVTDYTKAAFFRAVTTVEPLGEIKKANEKKWLHTVCGGKAEGRLVGGNLTLVCSSLGTPYEIDTRGRILLLEDLDMEPWMIDHSMCHLRNAGKFDEVKGIILGEFLNCKPFSHNPGYYVDMDVEDVFDYYIRPLKIPCFYGLPLGHTDDLATLPLGVEAAIDADNKTFTILENGVI